VNRYNKIEKRRNTNEFVGTLGTEYYRTVFYPEVEPSENDIYVQTEFGDRLDLLANQFYSDVSLYWIIAIANPNVVSLGSLTPPVGTQLRIPINISTIIDSYNRLNEL
tara:strand:- start:217 stop:540 length:324 start_codon:yes stop_codon:yes gene_type:complete